MTAKNLLTKHVPIASPNDTILLLKKKIKRNIRKYKSINYIYIIDEQDSLKGVISIKEIFRQKNELIIINIIKKNLVTARLKTKAEQIANLALKNNIKSIPIVDKNNKFLGAVLNDTILEVAYNEHQKDLALLAGIENNSKYYGVKVLPIIKSLKQRLPWLIVGLLGGFLMSKIIDIFEGTLKDNIILASFIPLIVYIGAAVQTQTGYLIVRDLAFNQKLKFLKYIIRQFKIVFLLGFCISLLVFFFSLLFYNNIIISLALSLAIFLAIISSIFTGVIIPFIFHKLKYDPASASGPIATIIQDLISIIIYLLVAKSIM